MQLENHFYKRGYESDFPEDEKNGLEGLLQESLLFLYNFFSIFHKNKKTPMSTPGFF